MSEMTAQQKNFIGYEYKEITAESGKASFLLDGYENFGWEADENFSGKNSTSYVQAKRRVTLRLKRNRKIINKMELTRLQRNFEACVNEIQRLEEAKTSRATMWALIVAIIGTAFMAGSTFAVTVDPPQVALCIVLAIPGFIGWILPFFLYKRIVGRQTGKLTPLIEAKYDEIYEICEKGNNLLH
ncbi:MAG: hypothetical protein NC086_04190 [Alistipes sp.]|nr:hypothetical protein [Alistipes sp.]